MTEAEQQAADQAKLDLEKTPNPDEDSSTSNKNAPFVLKRVVGQRDKLLTANGELDGENDDLAKEVVRLTQENKRLAEQGSQKEVEPPDPDQFETKEEFNAANRKFIAEIATGAVQNVITTQADNSQAVEFDGKVENHYQRAEKLGKPDYEQAEIEAVNALGSGYVNQIVNNIDNSEELLYMLGNSPKEMQRIITLQKTNPGKATVELALLSAKAGVFSKQSVPAPEDGVEDGGKAPSAEGQALMKKYNAALDKAADTGDNTGFREIRKKCLEAGLL